MTEQVTEWLTEQSATSSKFVHNKLIMTETEEDILIDTAITNNERGEEQCRVLEEQRWVLEEQCRKDDEQQRRKKDSLEDAEDAVEAGKAACAATILQVLSAQLLIFFSYHRNQPRL